MGGEIHSPYFFRPKGVESNHNHFWFDIYPSDFAGSLARWDFHFPAHEAKFRARLPAKPESRYRTRDGWGSILQCFSKKSSKSANLKIKFFQFFFSEPGRSPGWGGDAGLERREGEEKREKERHTGKRGEETKISVFVEAELQGPSKSEKKISKWEEEGKMAGEAKMAGLAHTASHT